MDNRRNNSPVHVQVYPLVTLFLWAIGLLLFFRFFAVSKLVLLGLLAVACVVAAIRPILGHIPGPRWLSAIGTVVLVFVILAGIVTLIFWLLAGQVQQEISEWPALVKNINELLAGWSQRLGLGYTLKLEMIWARIQQWIMGGDIVEWVGVITNIVSALMVVMVFLFFGSIYVLSEPSERFVDPFLRLFAPEHRPQMQAVFQELDVKLRWWLIGTLMSMTVISVISALGFWLIGLKLAIPIALLAGLAEIIPTVGPLVAFLLAFLFGLTQGSAVALGVVIVYVVNQIAESYILLPLVMKQAVKIPPVVTLFTIVLWGNIFGLPGLLLAIPIDLVVWTLIKHLGLYRR